MTILIIHGIGGHAGIHWQQWLKSRLEDQGHTVLMPEMPNADKPDRNQWLNVINETLGDTNPSELVIVGHSLGVTTALDYISSHGQSIAGLVSVAGFANDYGAELNSYFLAERNLDFAQILPKIRASIVIYSDDDPYVPQLALEEVATGLNVVPVLVHEGGHINTDTGFTEFPQLLELMKHLLVRE